MNREEKSQLYEKALTHAEIALKGKNNLYTSHNGHMFSFLGKEDILAVRLSEGDKKAYNEQHGTTDVKQYGATMRGYVEVTDEIAKDPEQFAELLKQGLAFVSSLPPKPTKK